MRWWPRCRSCSTTTLACRTRPRRFSPACSICRGSSNRLWSPAVDMLKTRRLWIWTMQLLLGAGLAGVALMIPAPHFFQLTHCFFWLLAFSSATHDIAADGFYMLATDRARTVILRRLPQHVLSTSEKSRRRAGWSTSPAEWHARTGNTPLAWSAVFALAAGIFPVLGASITGSSCRGRHRTSRGSRRRAEETFWIEFLKNVRGVFPKAENPRAVALPAALPAGRGTTCENHPHSSCTRHADKGGLGLDHRERSAWLVYGTVGVIAFMAGALLGGFVVARHGLKFWLWPMLLAIHLPDAVFIWLAYAQPENLSSDWRGRGH